MQITDLQPSDAAAVEQAAHALVVGFREHAPDAWPDLAAARTRCTRRLNQARSVVSPVTRTAACSVGSAGICTMRGSGSCIHSSFILPSKGVGSGAPWSQIWRCKSPAARRPDHPAGQR